MTRDHRTLNAWYDGALPAETFNPNAAAEIAITEVNRLTELQAIAVSAVLVPRRLGGDATGEELRIDNLLCRRIAHATTSLLRLWDATPTCEVDPDGCRTIAAKIIWSDWWDDHQAYLDNRRRRIATWSIRAGILKTGNVLVFRLTREEDLLKDAFKKS